MQLRHLKTFAAVASTLNITRAGEKVHLAQSSVTEQIQSLEADLGAPLFDRSRHRLRLTEAGRRLLEYAGDLLSLADEARSAVADAAGLVAVLSRLVGWRRCARAVCRRFLQSSTESIPPLVFN